MYNDAMYAVRACHLPTRNTVFLKAQQNLDLHFT